MKEDSNYSIVTEVGTFGDVNIKDPTARKVEKDDETEALIRESIENNAKALDGMHN